MLEYATSLERVMDSTDKHLLHLGERWVEEGRDFRLIWGEQKRTQRILLQTVLDAFDEITADETPFSYPIRFLKLPKQVSSTVATVSAVASGTWNVVAFPRGRFRFLAGDPKVRVQGSQPERTTVDREVAVTAEVGSVVVDARLTPLAEPVTLTPLSPQGPEPLEPSGGVEVLGGGEPLPDAKSPDASREGPAPELSPEIRDQVPG